MNNLNQPSRTLYCLSALVFLFCQTGISQNKANEGLDYGYKVHARSHSPALALVPSVGYGILLWGNTQSPFYGYIRPSISPIISPSLIGAEAELSIFPVSFFGVSVGQRNLQRFLDPVGQDCDQVQCQGELRSQNVSSRLLLAYKKLFLSAAIKRIFYDINAHNSNEELEPNYSLLLPSGRQQIQNSSLAVGMLLHENASIGILIQRTKLKDTSVRQEAEYLFTRSSLKDYGYEKLNLTLGAGRYSSDLQPESFSLILSLEFVGQASLNLY